MSAELEPHPAAALLPMLGEAELAELAEDIKLHGLQHAIILDADNRIIDGRNRYAACQLAGVEPRFEEYQGDDPLSVVITQNIRRRNLTKPQLAIASARAWQQAQAEGLVQVGAGRPSESVQTGRIIVGPRNYFGQLFGVSKHLCGMARRVVDFSSELAESVATGTLTLEQAYDQAMEAERHNKQEQDTLRRLREMAPDLIERIQLDNLTIGEADAIFRERDRAFREKRHGLFRLLEQFADVTEKIANTPSMLIPDIIDVPEFELEFREVIRGGVPELQERLRRLPDSMKVVSQMLRELDRRRKRT